MTIGRLITRHWSVIAMSHLQYRGDLVAKLIGVPAQVAVAMGGVWVVFSNADVVAGWSATQMLVLVGVYQLLVGIMSAFITPGMHRIHSDVQKGSLDYLLLQPHDAQFLAFVREIDPWELLQCAAGLGLVVWGISVGEPTPSVIDLFIAAALLVPAVLLAYAFLLAVVTVAFWSPGTGLVNLVTFCFDAGRWPLAVYPGWLQAVLTFVIPAGIAITVPSQALTGKLDASSVALLLAATISALVISRVLWRIALRSYTSASS